MPDSSVKAGRIASSSPEFWVEVVDWTTMKFSSAVAGATMAPNASVAEAMAPISCVFMLSPPSPRTALQNQSAGEKLPRRL